MTELWLRLAELRARTGIKQHEIAAVTEVCRQTVRNWRTRKPKKETAEKLVLFFPQYITMRDCGYTE